MTVVLGTLKTMNGAKIDLSKAGDMVTIEKAVVTRAALTTTNGAVHIIDSALMPPI